MYKILFLFLAVSLLTFPVASYAEGSKIKSDMPIEVLYDGRKIQFDVKPRLMQNSVMVPIRFVSDKLGGELNVTGKGITITKGDRTLKLTMNSKEAFFNGQAVSLIQPAIVENGRTLVPLRAISEGLDVPLEWDQVTKFVWIGEKIVPELKDIIKPVSLEPYMHYFKDREFVLELYDFGYDGSRTANTAFIVDQADFPFSINGEHFYRYDLAYHESGKVYIKATTTDKGSMATQIYYMGKTSKLRYRASSYGYQENINDFRIHYYPVVEYTDTITIEDNNPENYSIDQADYIGIKSSYSGLILVKNPFK